TCQITLNEFSSALATYQQARDFCKQNSMPRLLALADYNIAWLYYLRGDYGRAIQMLRNTREGCRSDDDKYIFALCHMDLSELYQALLLCDEGRLFEARRLCAAALEFFDSSTLKGKAVLCYILMARLHARNGELKEALAQCACALEKLGGFEAPMLSYQATLQ